MICDGKMMCIEIRQLVFIGFFVNGTEKSLLHLNFFVNVLFVIVCGVNVSSSERKRRNVAFVLGK